MNGSGVKQFLTKCKECGRNTSKKYAKANDGKCKTCVTGVPQDRGLRCPDCGRKTLTVYQKQHGYHCDICTRNTEQSGGIYGF